MLKESFHYKFPGNKNEASCLGYPGVPPRKIMY